MVHLDYRDARPIYTQIMDGFREKIAAGVLQPGDRLPSVRDLAMELSINPNTIQRSYRQLEQDGWIMTIQGKGCFVCSSPGFTDREVQRLPAVFDSTAAALMNLGISREDFIRRLQKEENTNA